jgi:hypothetical protein
MFREIIPVYSDSHTEVIVSGQNAGLLTEVAPVTSALNSASIDTGL